MLSVIAIDEAIATKMLVALQKCGNALVGGCGSVHCALCTALVGGCGSANITFVGYFSGQPSLFHYRQNHYHNHHHRHHQHPQLPTTSAKSP